jgi:hypothetical protein
LNKLTQSVGTDPSGIPTYCTGSTLLPADIIRGDVILLEGLRHVGLSRGFASTVRLRSKTHYALDMDHLAEAEGHHPDLYLAWGKCKLEIWSHKIKGLTNSDFVLAAKAERKFKPF